MEGNDCTPPLNIVLTNPAQRSSNLADSAWPWTASRRPPLTAFIVIAIDPLQKLLNLATERGIFSKVRGSAPGIRVSLYADDAALFLAPAKKEVSSLAALLTLFGEATGLKTNFHKSTVVPIHCNGLNLRHVLAELAAKSAHFPIKYLGLPLTTGTLAEG